MTKGFLTENGEWRCDCNPRLPAVFLEVRRADSKNIGRWFYTCQKGRDAPDKCGMFLWDTEARMREAKDSPLNMDSGNSGKDLYSERKVSDTAKRQYRSDSPLEWSSSDDEDHTTSAYRTPQKKRNSQAGSAFSAAHNNGLPSTPLSKRQQLVSPPQSKHHATPPKFNLSAAAASATFTNTPSVEPLDALNSLIGRQTDIPEGTKMQILEHTKAVQRTVNALQKSKISLRNCVQDRDIEIKDLRNQMDLVNLQRQVDKASIASLRREVELWKEKSESSKDTEN